MPHKKSHRYLFGNGEIAELIFCLFPWSTLTGADHQTGRLSFFDFYCMMAHHMGRVSMENKVLATTQRVAKGASL